MKTASEILERVDNLSSMHLKSIEKHLLQYKAGFFTTKQLNTYLSEALVNYNNVIDEILQENKITRDFLDGILYTQRI